MNNKVLYPILALVVVGGIVAAVVLMKPKTANSPTNTSIKNTVVTNTGVAVNTNAVTNTAPAGQTLTFNNPKKSAHYESNTPAHASVLAAVPINVVIDFNFDLHAKSTISVMKDGQEYGTGGTTVDTNKLTLRRTVDPAAPNGLYTVSYSACWPDGSCHDGYFQFAIDRTQATSYLDLRGQTAVNVSLKNLAFSPMDIRISSGTMVTWVNDDTAEHYVNTDSHPAHTYYPSQNSRSLKTGDKFTQTFATAGAYPYHCSAHAGIMTGSIVVE